MKSGLFDREHQKDMMAMWESSLKVIVCAIAHF